MPPSKGPLWEFFYAGEKQNSTHNKAYCLGCIRHHVLSNANRDGSSLNIAKVKGEQWFKDGT
jgi:hypothetical protein